MKVVHHAPSSSLAHLTQRDQELFYQLGIGPSRSVPIPIIHHAFEKHAAQQPDAIAVEHNAYGHSITYRELDMQSDRLANRLRSEGIVPGRRVCILARRSVVFVTAVLAVLKSGGQYIPLDAVTIKDETLCFVLEDAAPDIVLVMEEYAYRVPGSYNALCLEDVLDHEEQMNPHPSKVEDLSSPTDGAYCIYTSGTTGRPKGVDVRHNGVTNVISGQPGNVSMAPGLRVAHLLNIAFDMGAWEILGSLYNGATLCIRGNSKKEWIELLKTVHIVIATPSILALHEPEWYPDIKSVIVGGEPCPQALADKWARHTRFNNCCGPTEISVMNTAQRHTEGYPLSIGRPIPNTNIYILSNDIFDEDEDGVPKAVPIGEVGSMWVGGIGVSRGYLNLPDKTAERWKKDPFVRGGGGGPDGTAWMFNTGDLGRWRADGQLDHCGRADDQVKVKGFRVELDGVSSSLREHPQVHTATTLLIDSLLWGFVTPSHVPLDEVRETAARTQPYYAVPTHIMALDEFPMTGNGKVDRKALRIMALQKDSFQVYDQAVYSGSWSPPRTPLDPPPLSNSPSSSSSSLPSPSPPSITLPPINLSPSISPLSLSASTSLPLSAADGISARYVREMKEKAIPLAYNALEGPFLVCINLV